jgi:hypothetical protein
MHELSISINGKHLNSVQSKNLSFQKEMIKKSKLMKHLQNATFHLLQWPAD